MAGFVLGRDSTSGTEGPPSTAEGGVSWYGDRIEICGFPAPWAPVGGNRCVPPESCRVSWQPESMIRSAPNLPSSTTFDKLFRSGMVGGASEGGDRPGRDHTYSAIILTRKNGEFRRGATVSPFGERVSDCARGAIQRARRFAETAPRRQATASAEPRNPSGNPHWRPLRDPPKIRSLVFRLEWGPVSTLGLILLARPDVDACAATSDSILL